ncbi:MAG: hypothetical protein CL678_04500 [Bdellovibrionaceae bacterium]|nr:hypothetical protein [Pseudobdellovibrionaceae bacterium]|tara:strand:+ start:694 stop:2487 length:1794 start_codon:yes stop_codon:yes gene_type:complete
MKKIVPIVLILAQTGFSQKPEVEGTATGGGGKYIQVCTENGMKNALYDRVIKEKESYIQEIDIASHLYFKEDFELLSQAVIQLDPYVPGIWEDFQRELKTTTIQLTSVRRFANHSHKKITLYHCHSNEEFWEEFNSYLFDNINFRFKVRSNPETVDRILQYLNEVILSGEVLPLSQKDIVFFKNVYFLKPISHLAPKKEHKKKPINIGTLIKIKKHPLTKPAVRANENHLKWLSQYFPSLTDHFNTLMHETMKWRLTDEPIPQSHEDAEPNVINQINRGEPLIQKNDYLSLIEKDRPALLSHEVWLTYLGSFEKLDKERYQKITALNMAYIDHDIEHFKKIFHTLTSKPKADPTQYLSKTLHPTFYYSNFTDLFFRKMNEAYTVITLKIEPLDVLNSKTLNFYSYLNEKVNEEEEKEIYAENPEIFLERERWSFSGPWFDTVQFSKKNLLEKRIWNNLEKPLFRRDFPSLRKTMKLFKRSEKRDSVLKNGFWYFPEPSEANTLHLLIPRSQKLSTKDTITIPCGHLNLKSRSPLRRTVTYKVKLKRKSKLNSPGIGRDYRLKFSVYVNGVERKMLQATTYCDKDITFKPVEFLTQFD